MEACLICQQTFATGATLLTSCGAAEYCPARISVSASKQHRISPLEAEP
jgi:hypothetical protein